MKKIFIDTETCGLHGPAILLQYAIDDGSIILYELWKEPVGQTLAILEDFTNHAGIFFNATFDIFHICKIYTMFLLLQEREGSSAIPEEHIETLYELEPLARDGPCYKFKSVFDLLLHAKKGPFQSCMERRPIKIRKVPVELIDELAKVLEEKVKFSDLYFERRKDKTLSRWRQRESDDPNFRHLVLEFKPSTALKSIVKEALKEKEDAILKFVDIEPPKTARPSELGFAPFGKACENSKVWEKFSKKPWNGNWLQHIQVHIDHWHFNELARKYASKDVEYTRRLYEYFGSPEVGDDDSILAGMVAACRWRGYAIDVKKMIALKCEAEKKLRSFATNPKIVKKYIGDAFSDIEKAVWFSKGTTKKTVLEETSQMTIDCPDCDGNGCEKCENGLVKHPAAIRAKEVLEARMAKKEIEMYDKLLLAGRLHASFKVIGTLSSRMSGADGFNTQGIKRSNDVRSAFPLAFPGMVLTGGDFSGFEVTIADAVYQDPRLHKDLLSGKSIHALFGVNVYPGMTYEEILATKGSKVDDKYTRCKNAVFSMFFGGTAYTLKTKLNVDLEDAERAVALFHKQYTKVGEKTVRIIKMFQSLTQPEGIGTRVIYQKPAEYIESMYGFRRYFTLENSVIKALYDLGENPPKEWLAIKIRTRRSDREQFVGGAVRSALFGAAFSIMSSVIRAAKNHEIQSTGASITKKLQRSIWELQPYGVHPFKVQPFNVHDEIQNPTAPEMVSQVEQIVKDFIEKERSKIPLLEIEWKSNMKNWADK